MAEEETYKCDECDKEFDSERGLHIHQGQKHKETAKEEENKDEDTGTAVEEKDEVEETQYSESKVFDNKIDYKPNIKIVGVSFFIIGFIVGSLFTMSIYELYDAENNEVDNWEDQVQLEGEPFLGDEDAPITIVSYEDFFCPFCGAFNNEAVAQEIGGNSALPQIKEEYIEEGYVKFYFKHFPTQGGVAPAVASECVAEQNHDAFWEFHDEHYERTLELTDLAQEDHEQYEEELVDIAEGLDINQSEFETCFDNQETMQKVQSDFEEGQELGVEGTPGIIVEGEMVSGAQPFNVFQGLIEEHL